MTPFVFNCAILNSIEVSLWFLLKSSCWTHVKHPAYEVRALPRRILHPIKGFRMTVWRFFRSLHSWKTCLRLMLHLYNWWTCAELNCGLTRFLRGHYTLSLRSISFYKSPQTTLYKTRFRKSFRTRGNQPVRNVPYWFYALFPTVGRRGRTELNAVKPQVLHGELRAQRSIFCFYFQHLN